MSHQEMTAVLQGCVPMEPKDDEYKNACDLFGFPHRCVPLSFPLSDDLIHRGLQKYSPPMKVIMIFCRTKHLYTFFPINILIFLQEITLNIFCRYLTEDEEVQNVVCA